MKIWGFLTEQSYLYLWCLELMSSGWIIDNDFKTSKNSIKYEQEEAEHVVKNFSFPFDCKQSF